MPSKLVVFFLALPLGCLLTPMPGPTLLAGPVFVVALGSSQKSKSDFSSVLQNQVYYLQNNKK